MDLSKHINRLNKPFLKMTNSNKEILNTSNNSTYLTQKDLSQKLRTEFEANKNIIQGPTDHLINPIHKDDTKNIKYNPLKKDIYNYLKLNNYEKKICDALLAQPTIRMDNYLLANPNNIGQLCLGLFLYDKNLLEKSIFDYCFVNPLSFGADEPRAKHEIKKIVEKIQIPYLNYRMWSEDFWKTPAPTTPTTDSIEMDSWKYNDGKTTSSQTGFRGFHGYPHIRNQYSRHPYSINPYYSGGKRNQKGGGNLKTRVNNFDTIAENNIEKFDKDENNIDKLKVISLYPPQKKIIQFRYSLGSFLENEQLEKIVNKLNKHKATQKITQDGHIEIPGTWGASGASEASEYILPFVSLLSIVISICHNFFDYYTDYIEEFKNVANKENDKLDTLLNTIKDSKTKFEKVFGYEFNPQDISISPTQLYNNYANKYGILPKFDDAKKNNIDTWKEYFSKTFKKLKEYNFIFEFSSDKKLDFEKTSKNLSDLIFKLEDTDNNNKLTGFVYGTNKLKEKQRGFFINFNEAIVKSKEELVEKLSKKENVRGFKLSANNKTTIGNILDNKFAQFKRNEEVSEDFIRALFDLLNQLDNKINNYKASFQTNNNNNTPFKSNSKKIEYNKLLGQISAFIVWFNDNLKGNTKSYAISLTQNRDFDLQRFYKYRNSNRETKIMEIMNYFTFAYKQNNNRVTINKIMKYEKDAKTGDYKVDLNIVNLRDPSINDPNYWISEQKKYEEKMKEGDKVPSYYFVVGNVSQKKLYLVNIFETIKSKYEFKNFAELGNSIMVPPILDISRLFQFYNIQNSYKDKLPTTAKNYYRNIISYINGSSNFVNSKKQPTYPIILLGTELYKTESDEKIFNTIYCQMGKFDRSYAEQYKLPIALWSNLKTLFQQNFSKFLQDQPDTLVFESMYDILFNFQPKFNKRLLQSYDKINKYYHSGYPLHNLCQVEVPSTKLLKDKSIYKRFITYYKKTQFISKNIFSLLVIANNGLTNKSNRKAIQTEMGFYKSDHIINFLTTIQGKMDINDNTLKMKNGGVNSGSDNSARFITYGKFKELSIPINS